MLILCRRLVILLCTYISPSLMSSYEQPIMLLIIDISSGVAKRGGGAPLTARSFFLLCGVGNFFLWWAREGQHMCGPLCVAKL